MNEQEINNQSNTQVGPADTIQPQPKITQDRTAILQNLYPTPGNNSVTTQIVQEPKKKSKKGILIISSVVLFLLISVAGGYFLYANNDKNAENTASNKLTDTSTKTTNNLLIENDLVEIKDDIISSSAVYNKLSPNTAYSIEYPKGYYVISQATKSNDQKSFVSETTISKVEINNSRKNTTTNQAESYIKIVTSNSLRLDTNSQYYVDSTLDTKAGVINTKLLKNDNNGKLDLYIYAFMKNDVEFSFTMLNIKDKESVMSYEQFKQFVSSIVFN